MIRRAITVAETTELPRKGPRNDIMKRLITICSVSLLFASTSALAAECDDQILVVEAAIAVEMEQPEPLNVAASTELLDRAIKACDSFNLGEDVDADGNRQALQLLAIAAQWLNND